ncbi:MAG TPA: DUF423 domain-containing protein [Thermoanaerobaculia bacterium]|nr:DUF423 domain-containing protein [Thermoanaerobaculia bacterium]
MSPGAAVAASVLAALAVAAGAFGAHGLAERLGPRDLALWETGARYLTYAALAALAMSLAPGRAGGGGALWVLGGGAWFAATLFGLALGGPRWLGALTPIGGVAMILGFLVFAASVWRGAGGG